MEKEQRRLVIDGKGTEKIIHPGETLFFSEKKERVVDEEAILKHLQESRRLAKEMSVGQREATVRVTSQYPDIPMCIWLWCDSHLGSKATDYERFLHDYRTVMETPNFFAIINGDSIDHFMVGGSSAPGTYEDAISPEQQALLVRKLIKKIDIIRSIQISILKSKADELRAPFKKDLS